MQVIVFWHKNSETCAVISIIKAIVESQDKISNEPPRVILILKNDLWSCNKRKLVQRNI